MGKRREKGWGKVNLLSGGPRFRYGLGSLPSAQENVRRRDLELRVPYSCPRRKHTLLDWSAFKRMIAASSSSVSTLVGQGSQQMKKKTFASRSKMDFCAAKLFCPLLLKAVENSFSQRALVTVQPNFCVSPDSSLNLSRTHICQSEKR